MPSELKDEDRPGPVGGPIANGKSPDTPRTPPGSPASPGGDASSVGVIEGGGESVRVDANFARLTEAVDRDANPTRPAEPADRDAVLTTAPKSPAPRPEPAATSMGDRPRPIEVPVELKVICGDLFKVPSPAAVIGRYLGLPLQGTAAVADELLGHWIKRSSEAGIVGARLGEIALFPSGHWKPRPMTPEVVLHAGMGDASHFTRSDLQYIYMNIVLALKSGRLDGFSTTLVNASRYGLTPNLAALTVLEGVRDAYERLACVDSPGDAAGGDLTRPFRIAFVEPDPDRYALIEAMLEALKHQATRYGPDPRGTRSRVWLNFRVMESRRLSKHDMAKARHADVAHDSPRDTIPSGKVVRLTITAPYADLEPHPSAAPGSADDHASHPRPRRQIFQCTAVTESSVIPVREQDVAPYFVEKIPERIRTAETVADQEKFGLLLPAFLLPEDFVKLINPGDDPTMGGQSLTLVVDRSSAAFPWEMAAIRDGQDVKLFGPDLQLTRQFRTLLADSRGVPPPLNDHLEVLVIADPADDPFRLPHAFEEGVAVARALVLAQKAWGGRLGLGLTLRLGGPGSGTKRELAAKLREMVPGIPEKFAAEADTCDPVEILALLMGNRFDVVHYAGHGVFDPSNAREGWVFNEDCILSAREIFKIRQVPRLVFANACLSTAMEVTQEPLPRLEIQQVSLAEAFFARGIENYIGAGWKVDDELAADFATRFYLQALGVTVLGPDKIELKEVAPPATLGCALASARSGVLQTIRDRELEGARATIWGAYQHYGEVNSKLLPFSNLDAEAANFALQPPGAGPAPAEGFATSGSPARKPKGGGGPAGPIQAAATAAGRATAPRRRSAKPPIDASGQSTCANSMIGGPLASPLPTPGDLSLWVPGQKAAMADVRWKNGTTLKVGFLNRLDSYGQSLRQKVGEIAPTWSQHANIKFDFREGADADILINFSIDLAPFGTYSSELGSNAVRLTNQKQPSMHLVFNPDDANNTDDEFRRVILHEFGHALGLIHEHARPDSKLIWDEKAVRRFYAAQSGDALDWDFLKRNVIDFYSEKLVDQTAFDPLSIMMYRFPKGLATFADKTPFSTDWNRELSPLDQTFIASMYPA